MPGLIPLYVVSALSSCLLAAAVVHERFIDLRVYRAGGEIALHGGDLSRAHFGPLPFTYPPFAAAVLAPLAVPSWLVARIVMTAASVIALPLVLFLALRLPPAKSWLDRRDAGCLALVAAAAAVWLEPVRTMLGLGQVDMLLALAVLADLALPASSRFKGALTGIAAGIKLTPAIFIVYFLITKRYRAAATAVIAFAATVAIGFAILPASSAYYWNGTFLNPRRIGSVQSGQNVSLLGAIIRTLHHTNVADVWLPVAILLAAFGLTLAARAQRVGDEALGFSVCAIIGLLISPISWTHHWVLAVPALLLAALSTYRFRASRKRLATFASAAAITTAAVIAWSRPQFARGQGGGHWLHASPSAIVYSELYVVAGLVSLVVAATVVWRRAQAALLPRWTSHAGLPPPALRPESEVLTGSSTGLRTRP